MGQVRARRMTLLSWCHVVWSQTDGYWKPGTAALVYRVEKTPPSGSGCRLMGKRLYEVHPRGLSSLFVLSPCIGSSELVHWWLAGDSDG